MIPPENKTMSFWSNARGQTADVFSDLIGFAAIRVPLDRAKHPREKTLALPGYRQIDTYSCGAVAAAMAAKCLKPSLSFQQVHGAVKPLPTTGADYPKVTRALRSLGIKVACYEEMTFMHLCEAIDLGRPVLVSVTTDNLEVDHWVVVYGYGRRPNLLFIAGDGFPWQSNRMPLAVFRARWSPEGMGLVCYKAKPRKAARK